MTKVKLKKHPLHIALTGIIIMILFYTLPMDPGYELALALVPMFFIGLGILLSLIYWILIKITKRELGLLYFFFLIGNLTWGTLLAIDMAFNTFNF